MRQNLNYSTNKSALFACLFVLLLSLSLKRFVTPWELKKPNQAISGIPVSSQLIAMRRDFSLRIQLLSSGKNLQGSKLQSNHMHDCHMTEGYLGVQGEVSGYYGNGEVKGKYINLHLRWNAK